MTILVGSRYWGFLCLLAQEMAIEVGVEEMAIEIGVADQVTGGTIAERGTGTNL